MNVSLYSRNVSVTWSSLRTWTFFGFVLEKSLRSTGLITTGTERFGFFSVFFFRVHFYKDFQKVRMLHLLSFWFPHLPASNWFIFHPMQLGSKCQDTFESAAEPECSQHWERRRLLQTNYVNCYNVADLTVAMSLLLLCLKYYIILYFRELVKADIQKERETGLYNASFEVKKFAYWIIKNNSPALKM